VAVSREREGGPAKKRRPRRGPRKTGGEGDVAGDEVAARAPEPDDGLSAEDRARDAAYAAHEEAKYRASRGK